MSRHLSVSALALFLAVTGTAPTSAQQPQKTSVVFILADNVSYGDLGSALERLDGRGGVCWTAVAQRR
jgi:hypothetical protein